MAKSAVKFYCLSIVTRFAESLMIGFFPKQFHISFVRKHVINNVCNFKSLMNFERIGAKSIATEEFNSVISPASVVTAISCIWSGFASFPSFHALTTEAPYFQKIATTWS
jgi:hypothetical protein